MEATACSVRGQRLTLLDRLPGPLAADAPVAGPPAPSQAAKAGSRAEALAQHPASGMFSGTWPAHELLEQQWAAAGSGFGALPPKAAGTPAARQQFWICVATAPGSERAGSRRVPQDLLLRSPPGGTTAWTRQAWRPGPGGTQPLLANRDHRALRTAELATALQVVSLRWISSGGLPAPGSLGDVATPAGRHRAHNARELLVLRAARQGVGDDWNRAGPAGAGEPALVAPPVRKQPRPWSVPKPIRALGTCFSQAARRRIDPRFLLAVAKAGSRFAAAVTSAAAPSACLQLIAGHRAELARQAVSTGAAAATSH